MTDNANLTKKEQQELRGAEARLSRVAKLQQQLEEAREQASKNTVKKIEDINAQVGKLDERVEKVEEQLAATQQRKQHLLDRRDELVKAKYVLADEIEEFLSHEMREDLHLDATESVSNNTPLTQEQAEAIGNEAEQAEAEDDGSAMELEAELAQAKSESEEDESPAEADAKEEAKAEEPAEAKAKPATRARAKKQ